MIMLIAQQILLWHLLLTRLCDVQFISNLCLFSAWLAAEEVDLWSVSRRSVFVDYWLFVGSSLLFLFFSNFVVYHIPKEELAKFGYRSERKVESSKPSVIYLWFAGIYCLLENFPFRNNFATFFSQESFTWVALDLYWSPSAKICIAKKRLWWEVERKTKT